MKTKVPLLKPKRPDETEFNILLSEIWQSEVFTNNGEKSQLLEKMLSEYLGVPYVSLYANATFALYAALKEKCRHGEIITTPFTFLATANAIINAGLKPIFVDVDPVSYNIDPENILKAAGELTTGIMPVHTYGNPCDVAEIKNVSNVLNIPVIYDGAQAFGVQTDGTSILNFGDMSVVSMHATKVFSSIEGGFIVCHDALTKKRLDAHKNFGQKAFGEIYNVGMNSKLSELHAAVGIANLKSVDYEIAQRQKANLKYQAHISKIHGITAYPYEKIYRQNFNYMPIVVDESFGISRDRLAAKLQLEGIQTRKYFAPLVCDIKGYPKNSYECFDDLAIARKAAGQILCLPMYADITEYEIKTVCEAIAHAQKL